MPVPPPGRVLYTFHPVTDGWTDTSIYTYGCPDTCGEVSGTYDYRIWNTDVGEYVHWAVAYKETANFPNKIKRFRGAISLSSLPDDTSWTPPSCDIMNWGYSEEPDSFPGISNFGLFVTGSGKLRFGNYGDLSTTESSNAISAGTSYDIVMVIDDRIELATSTWRVYVDGELWLEDASMVGWYSDLPYIEFAEGLGWQTNNWVAVSDVTLHVGEDADDEHVWTIEGASGYSAWGLFI